MEDLENQARKILIVDDELIHLEAIIDVFEEIGSSYRILQAFSGNEAYKIAEKEIPDLIITDWEMPAMSGIELIKQLKENVNTKDIPIIMCTGVMTSSINLETALQAGAVDYIRKPIDKIELIARTKANLHLADNYLRISELNATKDKFFSIISHDLKGPINSLSSFVFMLKNHIKDMTKKEIHDLATDLEKSQKNVYSLLENLLSWSLSQTGQIQFSPEEFDLTTLMIDSMELLKAQAVEKNLELQNRSTKKFVINTHKNSIATVVRNLISNAIKFTPINGTVTLGWEQKNSDVIVTVTDTGVGMSSQQAQNIFQIGIKHSTYGTANEKGTGLGLILCKEFVEKNHGKIWATSELDVGSKFMFSLPINASSE